MLFRSPVYSSGAWFFYGSTVLVAWLAICAITDPGSAWTIVNVGHCVLTFIFFHWAKVRNGNFQERILTIHRVTSILFSTFTALLSRFRSSPQGSPLGDDQGKYGALTFWEQMDDGVQNTANRKFFTAVPVVLYLLAAHTSRDNLK